MASRFLGSTRLSTRLISVTPPPLTPPDAPASLTATPASASQVDLAWPAVSGAEGYRVYRGDGAVYETTAASYTDAGLAGLTTYAYAVTALRAGRESQPSPRALATTPSSVTPPAAPVNLTATPVSDVQIDLAWDAVVGATSYNLYRGGVLVQAVAGTAFSDTGRTASTSYTYYVTAVNGVTEGPPSGEVSATTHAAVNNPPSVPSGLAGSAVSDTATLSWEPSTDPDGGTVDHYVVRRDGAIVDTVAHVPSGTGTLVTGDPYIGQAGRTDRFVAVGGASSGPGSISQPWNLTWAINPANPDVGPGTTLWLREGTYVGTWPLYISGTPAAPIYLIAYPDERVTLKPAAEDVYTGRAVELRYCCDVELYNLEIDWPAWPYEERDDTVHHNDLDPPAYGYGVWFCNDTNPTVDPQWEERVKLRNLTIHNVRGQGIALWQTAWAAEIEGCNIYFSSINQWQHGTYTRHYGNWAGSGDRNLIRCTAWHHNTGYNIHLFPDPIHGYTFEYSAHYMSGGLPNPSQGGKPSGDFLVWSEDDRVVDDIILDHIWHYRNRVDAWWTGGVNPPNGYATNASTSLRLRAIASGAGTGYSNVSVTNSIWCGATFCCDETPLGDANDFTGNKYIETLLRQVYYGSSTVNRDWRRADVDNAPIWAYLLAHGMQAEDWIHDRPTDEVWTYAKAYSYNPQRALLVIYNWPNADEVEFKHAAFVAGGVDARVGDIYEIRDANNPFETIYTGVYNGTAIDIRMALAEHPMEKPVTWDAPEYWNNFPTYGCFFVHFQHGGAALQTWSESGLAAATYAYTVAAVDNDGLEGPECAAVNVVIAGPGTPQELAVDLTESRRFCDSIGTLVGSTGTLITGLYTGLQWSAYLRGPCPLAAADTAGETVIRLYASYAAASPALTYRIRAVKQLDPGVPADYAALTTLRATLTTAYVDWTLPSTVQGVTYESPSLAAIVTELVAQVGWNPNNDVIWILENRDLAATNDVMWASAEQTSLAKPQVDYRWT